jgi:hypothetical protein
MTHANGEAFEGQHDLVNDVHPQVSEVKEQVENVRQVVSPEKS